MNLADRWLQLQEIVDGWSVKDWEQLQEQEAGFQSALKLHENLGEVLSREMYLEYVHAYISV